MGHIPAIERVHRRSVRQSGGAQRHGVIPLPGDGKRLLGGFVQLFEGGFPPERRAPVGAALGVGQLHRAVTVGIFGPAAAGFVGVKAAGQVVGPAGIQAAVGTAHHIGPGGRRRGQTVRQGGRGGTQARGGHGLLTGRPAARRARRQASMAVALSSAVTRNRLGWQNLRARPLFSRRTSSG